MSWTIRRAREGDLGFLREMLVEAANWRRGNRAADKNDVLADPHVARYLAGWGRPGDTALLALDEHGQPVGAAWFRFFSRDEPAYGFIDETIPELSIAVRGDLRGHGIGTGLLNALVSVAREQGVGALSLSVEEDNPSVRLYERIGFRSVEKKGNAYTMRLDITPQHPWEREAGNWLGWARTPGFDAYWYYRDTFFDEIVVRKGRTLEVGCGEGRVARDLANRGHDVVAIDLTAMLLEHARDADPDLLYVRADAAALPFREQSFDTVVAYNSLMDVDDMPAAVREASRVLRPSGHFCVCVVHPMRDAGAFLSDEPGADFVISGPYFGPRPFKGTFEREGRMITFEGWSYSLQDYSDALEAAGLVLERLKEPLPADEAREKHPSWERSMRIPMFLLMRAVKRA